MKNLEDGYEYEWDLEKFQSRNYLIKELLNKYFEKNEIPVRINLFYLIIYYFNLLLQ